VEYGEGDIRMTQLGGGYFWYNQKCDLLLGFGPMDANEQEVLFYHWDGKQKKW
jgi:hypothetical protein